MWCVVCIKRFYGGSIQYGTRNMNTVKSNNRYSTNEAAQALLIQPATLRTAVWRDGAYYGVTPIKMPNGRLLWPADAVNALIAANS